MASFVATIIKYTVRHLTIFLFIVIVSACTPQRKLVYFQGAIPPLNADSVFRLRIFPGDILSVNIFTINPEAFPYLTYSNDRLGADNRSPYEKGYVVDDSGTIRLPLAGAIQVGGLTIPEATRKVEGSFKTYINDPVVSVKKLNFKVTVLGEVNRPGTYPVLNESATLPEVLGMAGDLSQFADRERLRIIRDENGKRRDFFVDLTSASSLTTENYYLHPGDIVYVQPVRRRAFQNISPSVTLFTSIITTAVVVTTFIITTSE